MSDFKGTGRANFTGGGATVTVPKDAAIEVFDLDSDGADVAYFVEGGKLIMVSKSEVTINERMEVSG